MTEVTLLYEQPLLKACHFLLLMSSGNRSEQAAGVNNAAFSLLGSLWCSCLGGLKLPAWPLASWIASNHLGWLILWLRLPKKKPWLTHDEEVGWVQGLTSFLSNASFNLKLSCLSSYPGFVVVVFVRIWSTAITPYINPPLSVIIPQIYEPYTATYSTKHTVSDFPYWSVH